MPPLCLRVAETPLPLPRLKLSRPDPGRWLWLPPLWRHLPGAAQRRRAALVLLAALLCFALRPWPPFQWLPGWAVGGLGLWALLELLRWCWRPRRWR
ncbi:MAG: hypothetical protein VKK62_03090 [Synechococcaceae cyanobacterium]|nr:hypothetical protein [Synechococcaceae cyanobacterium]